MFSGRSYILHTTEENVPYALSYNNAPQHVIGLKTSNSKLGHYTKWSLNSAGSFIPASKEVEFYYQDSLELNNEGYSRLQNLTKTTSGFLFELKVKSLYLKIPLSQMN